MSFGFGLHRCVGNRLGELQLRIAWEEILKRFEIVEVVGDPGRVYSNVTKGYSGLPVRVKRYRGGTLGMMTIIYMEFDGTEHEVDARPGDTLMSAAIDNSVPGIDGDCCGNCAFATCHVFVDGDLAGSAGEEERDMLAIADDVRENSRLGCQFTVTEAVDRASAHGAALNGSVPHALAACRPSGTVDTTKPSGRPACQYAPASRRPCVRWRPWRARRRPIRLGRHMRARRSPR